MDAKGLKEPEGIAFYSVKSGETHYCKLEPTIQAYINSSDMGINASRGQDYGWRLAAEWVNKVRDFQADEDKMDTLASKLRLEDGVSPTTIQILLYIYGRQVRSYLQKLREEDAPFAEQYQKDISTGNRKPIEEPVVEAVTEDVSEADLLPAEDDDEDDAGVPATPKKPKPGKS